MIGTNQHLLEQVEKQNLVIIRLKAKLAEARRVVDLQNRTWWLFHFQLYGLSLYQQVIKYFLCMPVKSQILQARIQLMVSFVISIKIGFNKILLFV